MGWTCAWLLPHLIVIDGDAQNPTEDVSRMHTMWRRTWTSMKVCELCFDGPVND